MKTKQQIAEEKRVLQEAYINATKLVKDETENFVRVISDDIAKLEEERESRQSEAQKKLRELDDKYMEDDNKLFEEFERATE